MITPTTDKPVYATRKHTTRRINRENHYKWVEKYLKAREEEVKQ